MENFDSLNEKSKVERELMLGQVYTPKPIADFMTHLLFLSEKKIVMDPCFGEGIFIKSIKESMEDISLIGIEIDPILFNNFSTKNLGTKQISLLNDDFFDINIKVDGIIMNPPYIRSELLNNEVYDFLNKMKINKKLKNDYEISSRSNLYIYFFLKAYELLEDLGEIVAIIPNTWMSSEFGVLFKKYLINNFNIISIYQFNKDVFLDATVDTCIIHLRKEISENDLTKFTYINDVMDYDQIINYKDFNLKKNEVYINQKNLKPEEDWSTYFSQKSIFTKTNNFIKMSEIIKVKRGITTNYNDFFIHKDESNLYSNNDNKYFQRIICSPKEVDGLNVKNLKKQNYLLSIIEDYSILPKDIKKHIKEYEGKIIKNQKPTTIFKKINQNQDTWFKLGNPSAAPIIFSYIIRSEKRFIYNNIYCVRDNFYELYPKKVNSYLMLAILNSNITLYMLEFIGRSYGKGLLKIQKYELDSLDIINPHVLNSKDKETLIKLGKSLSETIGNQENIDLVQRIDELLIKYVSDNMKVSELKTILDTKMYKRLNILKKSEEYE